MENARDGKQEVMENPQLPRRSALQDAFIALVEIALARGRSVDHGVNDEGVPAFSYLLTPKQFDRVRRICKEKGWDVPNQRGVLIDLEAVAHPLDARMNKDRCTVEEVLQILLAAYSPQIATKPGWLEQAEACSSDRLQHAAESSHWQGELLCGRRGQDTS